MTSTTRAWPHACILLLAGLLPAAAAAQTLPRPAEFYFDEDATVASPIVAIAGEGESTIDQLIRVMDRGGRNADLATAQLARLSMDAGRTETGLALYDRAMKMTSEGSARRRSLQWNQAWDLYRMGDVEGALSLWSQAVPGSVVHPSWAPPTLALALWKLDRRQEAVAWYAAAVRTYPDRWSDPAALPALLPDWTEADRAVLAGVLAAWREAPPAWP